jgi:hypothetical protein
VHAANGRQSWTTFFASSRIGGHTTTLSVPALFTRAAASRRRVLPQAVARALSRLARGAPRALAAASGPARLPKWRPRTTRARASPGLPRCAHASGGSGAGAGLLRPRRAAVAAWRRSHGTDLRLFDTGRRMRCCRSLLSRRGHATGRWLPRHGRSCCCACVPRCARADATAPAAQQSLGGKPRRNGKSCRLRCAPRAAAGSCVPAGGAGGRGCAGSGRAHPQKARASRQP